MVNIPPEHEQAVIERAKKLKRSVANYLEWLVDQDLTGERSGGAVNDPPGGYGGDQPKRGGAGKH